MEDIFKKTIYLSLIGCCFAGPVTQSWKCLKGYCEKREDEPPRQSQGSGGWNNPDQSISTASGTTQYMTAPYGIKPQR